MIAKLRSLLINLISDKKEYSEIEIPEEGISESGYLVNNKREGIWKIFYDDCLSQTVTYKNGEINGLVTLFEQDEGDQDVKITEGTQKMILDEGIKTNVWHGEVKYWDTHGNLILIDNFRNGKLHGESTWYSAGGIFFEQGDENRIQFKKIYKDGLLNGSETYFADDGTINITHFREGVKHGTEEEYFKNGVLKSKREWVDGKIEGLYETFGEDGKIKTRGHWKNSLRHGLMECFVSFNRYKKNYKHGYADGNYEGYFVNSTKVRQRGSYLPLHKIEKRDLVLEMERDSSLVHSYLKKKGIPPSNSTGLISFGPTRVSVKDGEWEYFDESGRCTNRIRFKNGRRTVND